MASNKNQAPAKKTTLTAITTSKCPPITFEYISYADDVFVFQGLNGLECEEFVFAVRKEAFRKDKYDDLKWMAAFAGSCCFGEALRWHMTLDGAVKNDWELLQQALFQKYPAVPRRPVDSGFNVSSIQMQASAIPATAPTPAAAPMPHAQAAAHPAQSDPIPTQRRGLTWADLQRSIAANQRQGAGVVPGNSPTPNPNDAGGSGAGRPQIPNPFGGRKPGGQRSSDNRNPYQHAPDSEWARYGDLSGFSGRQEEDVVYISD